MVASDMFIQSLWNTEAARTVLGESPAHGDGVELLWLAHILKPSKIACALASTGATISGPNSPSASPRCIRIVQLLSSGAWVDDVSSSGQGYVLYEGL